MTTDVTLPPLGLLDVNDPAPWFRAPVLNGSDSFVFDTMAGRTVLMLFFGAASQPVAAEALKLVEANRTLFDDVSACFFGITVDRADAEAGRIRPMLPGIRRFLDYDRRISAQYGALTRKDGKLHYDPQWVLLDPALRVSARFPIEQGGAALAVVRMMSKQLQTADFAPVITVPGVLEPEVCRQLVDLYEREGGTPSGFMMEVGGKTVGQFDHLRKKRADYYIDDQTLRDALSARIGRRLIPMIHRAFQFEATRIERYLLACYDGAEGGHFRAHRDNTTAGTAHRRFAVTINLTNDYDGGDLSFPEFGPRTYRAPVGGAIVFSCSLMHQANQVTRGRRYAFLPFLYDEAGAAIRLKNNDALAEGVGRYVDHPSKAGAATIEA